MATTYPQGRTGERRGISRLVAESPPAGGTKPNLLDGLREAIRVRHLCPRVEEAYRQWVRRYLLFHRKRHPQEMGEGEINAFLSRLAVWERASACAQNPALAPLLFLYRHVLNREIGNVAQVGRFRTRFGRSLLLTLLDVESPQQARRRKDGWIR